MENRKNWNKLINESVEIELFLKRTPEFRGNIRNIVAFPVKILS